MRICGESARSATPNAAASAPSLRQSGAETASHNTASASNTLKYSRKYPQKYPLTAIDTANSASQRLEALIQ